MAAPGGNWGKAALGLRYHPPLMAEAKTVDHPLTHSVDANAFACHCLKVSYDEVEEAIDDGAKSLADVQIKTTACTHCFGCRFDIERVLRDRIGEGYVPAAVVRRPEPVPGAQRTD